MKLRIVNGYYFINEVVYSAAIILAIRPNAPVLPEGKVSCHYEPGVLHILSDGSNQSGGPQNWPAADALLEDSDLATDAAQYVIDQRAAALAARPLEIKAAEVRAQRDRLLTACDWTQLPDSPLTSGEKADWATYRQELRDLPQIYPDPDDVIWPEQP